MNPLLSTNPFCYRLNLTPLDYVKIAVASVTIFPLRFIICFVIFLVSCTWANIAYFLLFLLADSSKPDEYHRIRKLLIKPCLVFLRMMIFVAGIRNISFIDKSKGSDDAPIIVFAPHSSFFDLYPGLFLPGTPSFLARKESQDVLFFGNFLRLAGTIFVKRESHSSRQETIDLIKNAAKSNRIIICPEGVCGNRSQMMKFKVGAFSPGLPVQPMVLKYHFSSGIDTVAWVPEGPAFFTLIWLTMCQAYVDIELTILPKYEPKAEEKLDCKLFAENVQKYISTATSIPVSPYIFDDVFFLKLANELGIPRSPCCMKLLKLSYKMSQLNNKGPEREMTASTNAGTKSEDMNLLFSRNRSDSRGQTTEKLQLLVNQIRSFDGCRNVKELPKLLELPEEISGSSSLEELVESITNRNMDPGQVLRLAAILCDVQIGSLWKRVGVAIEDLTGSPEGKMTCLQVKALLWTLIGLSGEQVNGNVADVWKRGATFKDLKANLVIDYRRAIDETAPSLHILSPS